MSGCSRPTAMPERAILTPWRLRYARRGRRAVGWTRGCGDDHVQWRPARPWHSIHRARRQKENAVLETVDLAYLGIAEAGDLFRRRELSPVELVNALIERT